MIDVVNVGSVARELKSRYAPLRAVTLTARLMQKAIFAGRSDEVVFWALVYAFYRGNGLNAPTPEQLKSFRAELLGGLEQPADASLREPMPEVRRRSARR